MGVRSVRAGQSTPTLWIFRPPGDWKPVCCNYIQCFTGKRNNTVKDFFSCLLLISLTVLFSVSYLFLKVAGLPVLLHCQWCGTLQFLSLATANKTEVISAEWRLFSAICISVSLLFSLLVTASVLGSHSTVSLLTPHSWSRASAFQFHGHYEYVKQAVSTHETT